MTCPHENGDKDVFAMNDKNAGFMEPYGLYISAVSANVIGPVNKFIFEKPETRRAEPSCRL